MGSRKRVYWKERKKEKLRTSARETFLISRRGTKKKGTGVWTVERQTQSPRHVTRVLPFLAAIVAIVRRSTANTSFPIVPVPPGRYLFPAARYPRYAPLTFKSIGYRGPRRRCATRVGNRAGRKNFSFSSPTFSESKRIYYLFLFFFTEKREISDITQKARNHHACFPYYVLISTVKRAQRVTRACER